MLTRIKLEHIFSIFTILATSVEAVGICHACIDGLAYTRVSIFNDNRFSGQLAIDQTANIVYFHYEDSNMVDHTASFDLDNIRFNIVPGITFSYARAFDQRSKEVYMGGVTGLYKYNPKLNKTELIGLSDKTILNLQYKHNILYTIYNTKGLYIYDKKQTKSITQLLNYTIDFFVVDRNDDIYFISDAKVHRLKKGTKQVKLFLNDIYVLAVDRFNNMFFIHPVTRGIYSLNYNIDKLMQVGAFAEGLPTKVVFDNNNNMIYLDDKFDTLYYLMPNFGRCKVTKGMVLNKKPKKKFRPSSKDRVETFNIESIK